MNRKIVLPPVIWAGLILLAAEVITVFLALREQEFLEEMEITLPTVSLGLPILSFFGAVVVVTVVMLLVPLSQLRLVFKALFAFLFAWGMMVLLGLYWPVAVAAPIAVAVALVWFFIPKIWLHNLLMVVTLIGLGITFGVLLPPWMVIVLMLIISVYDVLAVRFGFMMWMVKKLSVSEALPALVLPRFISSSNRNLKGIQLLEQSGEKEFSILGGGDIGFPLVLLVSVFFAYGIGGYVVVAGFALLGLAGAYGVQRWILGGKATPALPPIFVLSAIGVLIVHLTGI